MGKANNRGKSGIPVSSGECPVTGKRRWLTRADAKTAARLLRRAYGNPGLAHYPCPHDGCDGFHVGTATGHTRDEHRQYHSQRDTHREDQPA